jgi:DNA-binding XRE family transcriptional regulator/mannose-6-phosphate isomerase-like protein (cupin superfamily)
MLEELALIRHSSLPLTNFEGEPQNRDVAGSLKKGEIDYVTVGRRIRQRRLEFDLSTEKLAELAGVARYTIVRIEKGLPSNPKTLHKVRSTLRLWSDRMTRPFPANNDFAVHRASETRWTVSMPKAEYQRRLVDDDPVHVNDPAERKRLGDLGFQPFFTAIFESDRHEGHLEQALMEIHKPSWVDKHFGEEFVYILRGRVTIMVNGVSTELEVGDSICFDATLPHQYLPTDVIGKDDLPALILVVVGKTKVQSPAK